MIVDPAARVGVSVDIERYFFVTQFLAREAMMLDERRFEDWFALLDPSITYEVPHRGAQMDYADEFTPGAFRLRDDINLLRVRVDRLSSGYAWAETPPSRTLRVVGSVVVVATEDPDVVAADSALLLYRQRGNAEAGHVIPVRRSDMIRLTDDGGRLLSRRAVIPDTVLQSPNLGIFV